MVEEIDLGPLDLWDRDYCKLGDAVAPSELDVIVTVVDQQHGDLPPVARVDQAGPVDNSYPVSPGVPRSGEDQPGVTLGNGHCDAGRDRSTFSRREDDVDSGVKIYGGIADMRWTGGGEPSVETYEVDLHSVFGASAE
jgi:hypothetical protein